MATPVYTADLMLGERVVAEGLAVQAWGAELGCFDIPIPPLHYPLGVTTDAVVIRRDGVVWFRGDARRVIAAAPGDVLRAPGSYSPPSYLHDYTPRIN